MNVHMKEMSGIATTTIMTDTAPLKILDVSFFMLMQRFVNWARNVTLNIVLLAVQIYIHILMAIQTPILGDPSKSANKKHQKLD